MKFALGIGLVAAALLFTVPSVDAAQKHSAKANYKPLKGVIYGKRRIGGYSYTYADVIDTRRFYDPTYGGPNSGGAIDHDFFWPRPTPPQGGDTPYLR